MNKFFYQRWWKDLCESLGLPRDSSYDEVRQAIRDAVETARKSGKPSQVVDVPAPGLVCHSPDRHTAVDVQGEIDYLDSLRKRH